ncbi:MAG: septal ring lytic transglycosylase RlpA family protein [Cyclobacteriaceae bacterium]
MKNINFFCVLLAVLLTMSCEVLRKETKPVSEGKKLIDSGVASWYGPGFHGKKTASGEIFDTGKLTAAHRTLPFGTKLIVRNAANNKMVTVKVNDRGPFAKSRIIDLSKAAAEKLDMINAGTAEVFLYLADDSGDPDVENIKKASYTIQVASYSEHSNAVNKAGKVPRGWIKEVTIKGQKAYRVFAGKFSDATSAKKHLVILKKQGINGFVKQIEN